MPIVHEDPVQGFSRVSLDSQNPVPPLALSSGSFWARAPRRRAIRAVSDGACSGCDDLSYKGNYSISYEIYIVREIGIARVIWVRANVSERSEAA